LPNNFGVYEKKMKEFVSMESKALAIYNLPKETAKEELLDELKNRGLYYWNENLKIINSLDSMDLPAPLRIRNTQLREYCEL
jgi:rhomboid protease GluP